MEHAWFAPRVLSLPMKFSSDVRNALKSDMPVVALESTIISHGAARGQFVASIYVALLTINYSLSYRTLQSIVVITAGMPYPDNVTTARQVEAAVRENGATPATIAIMDGKVCVGLSNDELYRVAKAGQTCTKVSRRDILPVLASGKIGATTVAATMLLANAAGIRIFGTGGIGGVHRGVETTMDVSADLTELGRTPVAVVCAGVKSVREATYLSIAVGGPFVVLVLPFFFDARLYVHHQMQHPVTYHSVSLLAFMHVAIFLFAFALCLHGTQCVDRDGQ
jgi:pseudouridine-5'-phosphate glycosidase